MHLSKDDIPVRLAIPGATVRQLPDFGTAAGTLAAEYFSLDAGTDIAPLLMGLDDDLCHAAHWGYLASGTVVVEYVDSRTERVRAGEVFYWPPLHTVRVEQDAELVMFSPQHEHGQVIEHIERRLAAMA
jgi:hypothetical protein